MNKLVSSNAFNYVPISLLIVLFLTPSYSYASGFLSNLVNNAVGTVENKIENQTGNASGNAVQSLESHLFSHHASSSQQASNQSQRSSYTTASSTNQGAGVSHYPVSNEEPKGMNIMGIHLGMTRAEGLSLTKKHGLTETYKNKVVNLKYVGKATWETGVEDPNWRKRNFLDDVDLSFAPPPSKRLITRIIRNVDFEPSHMFNMDMVNSNAPSFRVFMNAVIKRYGAHPTETYGSGVAPGNTPGFHDGSFLYIWDSHGHLISHQEWIHAKDAYLAGCFNRPPEDEQDEANTYGIAATDYAKGHYVYLSSFPSYVNQQRHMNACSKVFYVHWEATHDVIRKFVEVLNDVDAVQLAVAKTSNTASRGAEAEQHREVQKANQIGAGL